MSFPLSYIVIEHRNGELRAAAERARLVHQVHRAAAAAAPAPEMLTVVDRIPIAVRPVGPGDRARHAAMFARMSPESRRRRFLATKQFLTSRELDHFTDVDQRDHVALAAVDARDGSFVGVSRYVRESSRSTTAEAALEVIDDLQHCGIGTALAQRTLARARQNGIARLVATTLSENPPARSLLRRLDFRVVVRDGATVELELRLDPIR